MSTEVDRVVIDAELVEPSKSLVHVRELSKVDLKLVDSSAEVAEFMTWLSEDRNRPRIGVDFETSGLKDFRDGIRLGQIGDHNTGWAFPWQRWSGPFIEAMQKWQGGFVGHNIQFDTRFWTRDTNIRWPWERTDDTMYMAHVDNPARAKGLKPLTAMFVDRTAAAGQDALSKYMSKMGFSWGNIPVDNPYYWGYGAMDVVLTCRLADVMEPRIAGYRESYELEMAAARVCSEMALRGIRYDRDYTAQKTEDLLAYIATCREWAKREHGVVNLTSIPQLIRFFDSQGFQFEKLTPKGAPALDKEVLETIDHPVAATLLKVRKAQKIVSTYLNNFDEFSDDDDFVHADIWVCGTRTARMSVTDPALQTLPKSDKVVRNAFVPRPERRLISMDADQIELRLMSYFADDPGLRAAFAAEQSFFVTVAEQVLGETIDKEVDPRYKMIKSSIYARLYGAGDAKIARTAGVPVEIITELNRGFDESYPGVTRYMGETARLVQQRIRDGEGAYVMSEGGRKLPLEDDKPYVGLNYQIQCTAAEIFKRAMVDLDAAGLGDYLLMPVHDEIIADVPADQAEDIAKVMQEIATDKDRYGVPITWSADVLPGAWGGRELTKEIVA
jgi:DNA polymerase-1